MIPDTLRAALRRALPGFALEAIAPMPAKGLAHDHVRLVGLGLVARVPRWSQIGLDPAANLRRQAAGFARAAPSGHTPALHAVIEPGAGLPMGGLVVGEVVGRPPRLPQEMTAIAEALAALHRLPVPPPEARPPLDSPADPVAATLAVIARQAVYFDRIGLPAAVRAVLEAEWTEARRMPSLPPLPPACLVGTDTHPGNFLIDAAGTAWFVDLEKAQYGLPAIDLAHASLYTSTTWDPDVAAVLTPDAVAAFHAAWSAAVPPALAEAMRPWLRPMRRLTWLRSLSWMARWQAEGERLGVGVLPAVQAHVRARIADFFSPATIERVRADWSSAP